MKLEEKQTTPKLCINFVCRYRCL